MLHLPTIWQSAKSNSKESDAAPPVIWHDESRCAFLIESITRPAYMLPEKNVSFEEFVEGIRGLGPTLDFKEVKAEI